MDHSCLRGWKVGSQTSSSKSSTELREGGERVKQSRGQRPRILGVLASWVLLEVREQMVMSKRFGVRQTGFKPNGLAIDLYK